jgi:hypothetical protein
VSDASEKERENVAAELRRVREGVRERALLPREPGQLLPAPRNTPLPQAVPAEPSPEPPPEPPRPDGSAVNALWDLGAVPMPGGVRGVAARVVRQLLARLVDRQAAFNARQVQLDNELLAYLEARFAQTHRHYDTVLGIHGRHMQDIDQRHLILQEELVAHVHDLVRRIDLVLGEGERSRLSLEAALRDLRLRLARIEERLGGA